MDKRNWGITLSIDLYDCDPDYINSKSLIGAYCREVCDLIQMKRFGDPIIEWFGEEEKVKGFSLVQLIYTSSIVGHFAKESNAAYIDIFTCKEFDIDKAIEFSAQFFKSKKSMVNILHRK